MALVATIATPAGPFTIVAGDDDAVLASGWTEDEDALVERIAPRLRPGALRRLADLGPITRSAAAYLAGDVAAVDMVPVEQIGGAIPRARVAAPARDPAGRAHHLRGPGRTLRPGRRGRGSSGRRRLREQRGGAVRALPPGAGDGRLAARFPLGAGREAVAARSRSRNRRSATRVAGGVGYSIRREFRVRLGNRP